MPVCSPMTDLILRATTCQPHGGRQKVGNGVAHMLLLVNHPWTPIVTTRLTLSNLGGSSIASSALGSRSAGSSSISVGRPSGLTPAAS